MYKKNDGEASKTLIMIGDTLGQGDNQLGTTMLNFLRTIKKKWKALAAGFVNSGVKLTIGNRDLSSSGTGFSRRFILVCGTCLNHFGLLEQKRVGETTNMLDIVTSLEVAEKVISF
jgi:hypothetical protein